MTNKRTNTTWVTSGEAMKILDIAHRQQLYFIARREKFHRKAKTGPTLYKKADVLAYALTKTRTNLLSEMGLSFRRTTCGYSYSIEPFHPNRT